jgi:3-oxoacyl-[acyl-carrier protein] reductase
MVIHFPQGETTMDPENTFFGLAGKKGLIIGGGQGMGESSAVFLARAGCDVALVDNVPDRADAVGQKVRALGRHSVTIAGDVLDDHQIPLIVAEAEAQLDGLDLMVSIVGAAVWGSLLETTADIWDQQMRLNLRYFFLVAKHRLGGRPARLPDARRIRGSKGRADQPGANHGGRVGTA